MVKNYSLRMVNYKQADSDEILTESTGDYIYAYNKKG